MSAKARVPVLLVDDVPANLLALEGVLASDECETFCVHSGEAALAAVAGREYAVALVDVQMPGMDGIELASRMQDLTAAKNWDLPIIFVTASDANQNRTAQAYGTGAVDFLQKPLDPDAIRSKVRVFLRFFRSKERLRLRLEDALRAREEVLAMVSHDLRTPLNVVSLAAQRLDQLADGSVASPSARRSTGLIIKAVERMSRLVEDLLDLSKVEAGQPVSVELADVDLVELARETADLLEPIAAATGVAVVAEGGPPVIARCDAHRMRQVLQNLVGNAVKFSRAGLEVRLRVAQRGGEACIEVSDDGFGIPSAQLPRIFDAYWQGDEQRRRVAGLGLSIVKAIVDAHGGRVGATSRVGAGTTISVTLPASRPTPSTLTG